MTEFIYLLITAFVAISIAQGCTDRGWLRVRLGRFARWWMDPANPEPVWLFTLGFIALIFVGFY